MNSLLAALSDKELRNRLLYLIGGFAAFVLIVNVSIPGINKEVWRRLIESRELFSFLGMFTGGALDKFSIAAMGITPYINASIIMQLLTVVVPKLHEYQKEGGELGRKKINQYVRYLTMALASIQAVVMVISLMRFTSGANAVFLYTSPAYALLVIFALTAGTAALVWLGEMLSQNGIGNGTSMIIFAGIVYRYPIYLGQTLKYGYAASEGILKYSFRLALFFLLALALIVAIIYLTQGIRKIPVQYAKRVVGRRIMGGQNSYLPIKVNNAGVISIIFAISVLYLPTTFTQFFQFNQGHLGDIAQFINHVFSPHHWVYNVAYMALVIFFTYFYSAITFNIQDVSDNMKKNGGFVPGIRPGKATVDYLDRIMTRITFISAIALALIAVAPSFVMQISGVTSFYLGSTSLLIIVGVALDTMQQIEARIVMRNYQGFMK